MPTRPTTKRVVKRDPDSGFFAFIWRHRVGLAPPLYGVAVYILALVLRYIIKLDLQLFAITAGVASLVSFLFIRFASPDRDGNWHAKLNQMYLYLVTVATGVWGYWFQSLNHDVESLKLGSTVFGWALLVLAIPYWFDLRRRSRVTLDNMLDRWPIVTEGTRFVGSRISGFRKTSYGWKFRLAMPAGRHSAREILNSKEFIEQTFDEPPDSVTIDPVSGKSNIYDVTCVNNDPHTEAIVWDEHGVDSICDSAFIGKYGDHKDEKTSWWTQGVGGFHRLFGGLTRSGKSGLFHLLLGIYAEAQDVVFWLADLKDGTALLPWSPLGDWTVTTVEEALQMVQAAREVVGARSRYLARSGREVWEPSRAHPVLVIFIDEIAELLGIDQGKSGREAAKALVSVARKGAGVGVLLCMATQFPTLEALSSSQLRSQIAWRACFRVNKQGDAQYIIPNGGDKVDASKIPAERRGTCYVDAEGVMRMSPLRILYLAHEHIVNIVDRWFGSRPSMDAESLKWHDKELMEVYENRTNWTPDMLGAMRRGELDGFTEDDLYDAEEDEILFQDPADDVATANSETSKSGHGRRAATRVPSGHVATGDGQMATLDDGQRPEVAREWFDGELGRAAMAYMRRSGVAGFKAREAWLAERKQRPENEARVLFEQELDRAQVDGETRTVSELAKVCGRNERTVYRWVEDARNDGTLTRSGVGKYRRVDA
jgi:hypothetical protein